MNNFVLRRIFLQNFSTIYLEHDVHQMSSGAWTLKKSSWIPMLTYNSLEPYGSLKVVKTSQKVPKWCVWNETWCVNFEKKTREFLCWHSGLKSLMHWPTPISWKNCGIKVVLNRGGRRKNVPAFYGPFFSQEYSE